MTVLEREKELAAKAGRLAARTGRPLTACPFDVDGDGRQRVLALAFVRGWRAADRNNELDHPGEVIKSASMYDPDRPPDDSGEWVWVQDEIVKYEAWWPRDARGRWIKRSHLGAAMKSGKSLVEALREDEQRRTGRRTPQPAIPRPTWEDLGSPRGPSPIGQVIGYAGGTYERLPGEPYRYRVTDADGRDISDRMSIPIRGDGTRGNQTADDARAALRMDAFDRERIREAHESGSVAAQAAVSGSWSYDDSVKGFRGATAKEKTQIRGALKRWATHGGSARVDPSRMAEPPVNRALRGAIDHDDITRADVAALDRAFELSKTKKPINVYRGISDGSHVLPDDWQERDLTGTVWTSAGYTPVTGSRNAAEAYVGDTEDRGFAIRISLPKGSPAIAIKDDPGGDQDEGEIILPRGLTLRVTRDNGAQGEYGNRWLDVEIVEAADEGNIGKAAEPGGAGGADPKAQTPPPDQRWPGWEQDLAIAAAVAAQLTASMSGAITSAHRSAIVAAFLAWARAWRAGQPLPDVGGWLRASTQVRQRIAEAIGEVIRGGWAQGYMAGTRSAEAVLAAVADGEPPRPAVQITVDWGQWKPGDVAAARRIMAEDGSIEPFEQMLRDFGHTIERIAANRLDEIAAVLADGLEQGRTPKEIAEALTGVVNDRVWARKVAITETNRAMSAATLDTYTAADVAATSWMTALDQRVCPICFGNEFEADGVTVRVVPVGQRYPSGDYHPPGHPHCRCTLIPALLSLLKAFNPDQPRDRRGRWTRRAGSGWAARIASGITKREQLSDEGNYSKVELHHFGDGSKAVYKTGKVWEGDDQPMPMRDEHDAEELAAAVARVLGLKPPDVHRISGDEAYFEFVEDATLAAATSDPNKFVEDATLAATGDPDIAGATLDAHRIGLLDVLTENLDRNTTNWFIRYRPDGTWQLIPIDNALAWEAGRSFYGGRSPSEIASPTDPFAYLFARQSSARGLDGEWIDTRLSPEYVRELRSKLEALKPEFERLGHGDWHERMMVRLIHVEHRAKGDLHL